MKKFARILSVALVAAILLSISAIAMAETPTVFIPKKVAKLNLPERPAIPTMETWTTPAIPTGDPCPILAGEDPVIHIQLSEKPIWGGVNASSLDGGWMNLEFDETGYCEIDMEGLHRHPAYGTYSGPCDPETGKPSYRGVWGDFPYTIGFAGGITVYYTANGTAIKVDQEISEDVFKTGQELVKATVTWTRVVVKTDCGAAPVWYVSNVSADYADGSDIIRVNAEYRDNAAKTLYTYTITYARDEGTYTITYAGESVAAQKIVKDQVLSGTFTNGSVTLKTKSGNPGRWMNGSKNAHVRGVKSATSFASPRVER